MLKRLIIPCFVMLSLKVFAMDTSEEETLYLEKNTNVVATYKRRLDELLSKHKNGQPRSPTFLKPQANPILQTIPRDFLRRVDASKTIGDPLAVKHFDLAFSELHVKKSYLMLIQGNEKAALLAHFYLQSEDINSEFNNADFTASLHNLGISKDLNRKDIEVSVFAIGYSEDFLKFIDSILTIGLNIGHIMVRDMAFGNDEDGQSTIYYDPSTVDEEALSAQSIKFEASGDGKIYSVADTN